MKVTHRTVAQRAWKRRQRILAGLLAAVAALLFVTGCKSAGAGHDSAAKAEASKLAANPTVAADEAEAKKIFQGCVATGSWITKAGRKRIWDCAFPPDGTFPPGFQQCFETAFAHDVVSKAGRVKLTEADGPACFLKARQAAAK